MKIKNPNIFYIYLISNIFLSICFLSKEVSRQQSSLLGGSTNNCSILMVSCAKKKKVNVHHRYTKEEGSEIQL